MPNCRIDLQSTWNSLLDVQKAFPDINKQLTACREPMFDEVIENMQAGYAYVDDAISRGIDLFDDRHVHCLLELNHIVLCGLNPKVRKESRKHIKRTSERFYEQRKCNIDEILGWYQSHRHESVWKRTSGVYIRILSQPQLFFEGNHRTGALIMSYLLVREGKPPFVLTVDNAVAYFNPSTLIKQTTKTPMTLLVKLPKMKKIFAMFLQAQEDKKFLLHKIDSKK